MSTDDPWIALINDTLPSKNGEQTPIWRDKSIPLESKESSISAGSSDMLSNSPNSPTKKQGRGNSETLDARAGSVVEQFNCDKNTDWVIIVKASEMGHECGKCHHIEMREFARVKDRRTFHWRCAKGFEILEAHYGGERVHVAPFDCDQYTDGAG